jgi:hypothetical protein
MIGWFCNIAHADRLVWINTKESAKQNQQRKPVQYNSGDLNNGASAALGPGCHTGLFVQYIEHVSGSSTQSAATSLCVRLFKKTWTSLQIYSGNSQQYLPPPHTHIKSLNCCKSSLENWNKPKLDRSSSEQFPFSARISSLHHNLGFYFDALPGIFLSMISAQLCTGNYWRHERISKLDRFSCNYSVLLWICLFIWNLVYIGDHTVWSKFSCGKI